MADDVAGTLSLGSLLRGVPANEIVGTSAAKKTQAEHVKTLESFHSKHLGLIREERENIEEYRATLNEKKARLCAMDGESAGPSLLANNTDILLLTTRQKLEKEIQYLEDKVDKLDRGETVTDYFLRVGDILFSYSDAQERIAIGEKPIEMSGKKGRIPANSVYSYFTLMSSEEDDSGTKRSNPSITERTGASTGSSSGGGGGGKKASHIENRLGFQRDKALESFLSALNPDSMQYENAVASSISENYGNCPVCDTEMFVNETFLDCPECGYRDMILVDSEKPSYKDPPREMSYYAYKKINHLNEWLAQFQAKESTEISQAVLDQIRIELKKERITDMSKLKASKLKEVIKKLKLNRCYDHVAHILNRLNGISAPVLSREVEEKLRHMFREIQSSFVKHCPKKRNNFLSYSFVLYKFCELLELDEYLPCFPLLKSREKLYMQDKIWQKICEDMGWEFIRTV